MDYDSYIFRKAEEWYFPNEIEEVDENKIYQEYKDAEGVEQWTIES